MFKITQTLDERIVYPSLGIWMPSEKKEVEITYSAKSLISINSGKATVVFHTSIDGCSSTGELTHEFEYSGNGNPLEQAEDDLKSSLQ